VTFLCLAKDPPVFFQSLGVRVRTEVVQELRRTLDVGEQEATDWQPTHQDDAGSFLNIRDETCSPTWGDRINGD
jgi:hypothetical protein